MNFDRLKQLMDHLSATKVPGNAAHVYAGGKLVFSYASGYADLENRVEMTGAERLNIYSCSKVATVTAAAQLLERGVFLVTDPLYEYIPEYRHMCVKAEDGSLTEAKNTITVGDLFSMTAGFDYEFNAPELDRARVQTNGRMDTLEVARCWAKRPLCYEPGTRWRYSMAHDILAGLVCAVTGKRFRDYMQENIFEPLGITGAVYHNAAVRDKMAQQYRFVPTGETTADGDLVQAQMYGKTSEGTIVNVGQNVRFDLGSEYDSGGAGITVSVPEYAKLAAALANGGLGVNGARILAPSTVRLLHTDRLTAQNRADFNWLQYRGYGYGLGVRTLVDPAAAGALSPIGEFGWGGAAGAMVLADDTNNVAVFYAHHMLNPQETYYLPRVRNVLYGCLGL